MRVVLYALLLMPGAAAANDVKMFWLDNVTLPKPAADGKCENARMHHADMPGAAARIKPLEQERAAKAYHPVLRLQGGCDVPVMIREDIGGGPDAER